MNKALLQEEVQEFIQQNLATDVSKLVLKGSPFKDVSSRELAIQISGKQKAKKKLPQWYKSEGIVFPPNINLEQTSSEVTAKYKAQLVSGEKLIDLTGGFGIDSYFFSENVQQVIHCEQDEELSELAVHNFKILGVNNIWSVKGDSLKYLKSSEEKFDWIYLDPARRDDYGGKVFLLEQCTPDVSAHLQMFLDKADNLLIKTSPLLDLKAGLSEFHNVSEIHIVSVRNEVKELLWLVKKGFTEDVKIKAINFQKKGLQIFETSLGKSTAEASIGMPEEYIFEPNAAVMKSGLFGEVAQQTKTKKLHFNSHLYTSGQPVDFPGRTFKLVASLSYNRKALKKRPDLQKANIATRNFPKSVEAIRKELKIQDGGDTYLFFTTNMNNERIVLVCEKSGDLTGF